MKHRFFADIYPQHLKDPTGIWVRPVTELGDENQLPTPGSKRVVFSLEIPDDLFVDHKLTPQDMEIIDGSSEREIKD